jgi:hypothetical protein
MYVSTYNFEMLANMSLILTLSIVLNFLKLDVLETGYFRRQVQGRKDSFSFMLNIKI